MGRWRRANRVSTLGWLPVGLTRSGSNLGSSTSRSDSSAGHNFAPGGPFTAPGNCSVFNSRASSPEVPL